MNYVLSLLVAMGITWGITPFVIRFAKKFNLVDNPHTRYHPAHTHVGIIPRAGGLALFVGLITAIYVFVPLGNLSIAIIVSCFILTVVGLIDDHKDVHPYIRLLINIIATILVIAMGIRIPYITNPFGPGVIHLDTITLTFPLIITSITLSLADVAAFIWIMWTVSIVGWSAGVDGQMPGFVAISALVMGILSLRFGLIDPNQHSVTILAFIVCGVFLGFLPWNFYPQKIMPGYGGKTLAGFLLAILGILSYAKLGTAILVLSIPMIDAGYTLIRRIGKGKSPIWADRGHLHHMLLDVGWSKQCVALFYWGVSAILGTIALIVTSQQKIFTFLLVIVGVSGFLLWVHILSQFSKPPDQDNG